MGKADAKSEAEQARERSARAKGLGERMSRRRFLQVAGAATLAVSGSALLAACAPRSRAGSSSTASSSASSAAASSTGAGASSASSGSANAGSGARPSTAPQHVEVPAGANVLVAYFSRPGMNNYGRGTGEYHDLQTGYTKTVAGYMIGELNCDSFEIQPADPYPHDYSQTVQRNVDEERGEVYPEIANLADLPSIDQYDVVIMGSPVWNSQSPMIMRTFLRSYDFAGKIILPFNTYDMSRLGSVPRDYAGQAPQAQVSDAGLAVYECDAEDDAGRQQAHDWLAGFGLVEA